MRPAAGVFFSAPRMFASNHGRGAAGATLRSTGATFGGVLRTVLSIRASASSAGLPAYFV